MSALEKVPLNFAQRLAASWPPSAWRDLTVLAAVSGGADSVALLRALASLKAAGAGRLVVGHFNHGLRGDAAAADEHFVVALADQLGVDCLVGRATDGTLRAGGDGLEAAARQARYAFLQATAERLGARYVVTGHTADDQAETILHRVVRGTGLAGVAGMRRARALGPATTLLRPMLEIRRSEIEAYLAELGQSYRHDATNQDLDLTRNRLRHQLLPLLADAFNPAVVDALLRLGRLAAEAQHTIQAQAEDRLDAATVSANQSSVVLDCARLTGTTRHLVRELLVLLWQRQAWPLQAMTFSHWDELAGIMLGCPAELAASYPARKVFPGEVAVAREATLVRFTRCEVTATRPGTAGGRTPPGTAATK